MLFTLNLEEIDQLIYAIMQLNYLKKLEIRPVGTFLISSTKISWFKCGIRLQAIKFRDEDNF